MIEVTSRILEEVLKKDSSTLEWDERLQQSMKSVNSRVISYLRLNPTGILLGPLPEVSAVASTLLGLPGRENAS